MEIHDLTYQKTLLHIFLKFVFKSSKAFNVTLSKIYFAE